VKASVAQHVDIIIQHVSLLAVPVVVIFTKMDALDERVYNELLEEEDISFDEAERVVPSRAKAKFEQDYLEPLKMVVHPPGCTVQLRGM
jgi:hypothetical protein